MLPAARAVISSIARLAQHRDRAGATRSEPFHRPVGQETRRRRSSARIPRIAAHRHSGASVTSSAMRTLDCRLDTS